MIPISIRNKGRLSFFPRFASRHRLPGNGGFTLLEVMVAVSLLAIALPTLFGSQSQSVSLGSMIKFNTQAPLLAQLKLAEFTTTSERPATDSGDFGDEFPDYHWEVETKDAAMESSTILSQLDNTLQVLTLTVSRGNGLDSYRIQSYLLKNQAPR